MLFFEFNSKIANINNSGMNDEKARPVLREAADEASSENFSVIKLTNQGPKVQPVSPARASTLKSEPPPLEKSPDARLKAPGHIMLTVNPVNAHRKSEINLLSIKAVPK